MKTHLLLAASAALTLAACDGAADAPVENTDTAMTDDALTTPDNMVAGDMMAGGDMAPIGTPQAFADTAAASNAYEIAAAKVAQDKGSSAAVKDFAAMMIKDHTKATADLKAAAAQVEGVTVNAQMTPKQQADLDALNVATTDFDSVYVQQQIAAHEATLSTLQGYAASGDAVPLKDFAGKTAPVVEGHLTKARTLG